MLSLIFGLATMAVSLWGLFHWRTEFIFILKGAVPVCFLMGGVVAVIAGISSFGSTASTDSKPTDDVSGAAGEKE